ncbi:acyl-CoA dehydrogenase family protein [Parahaliea aestuarii]|uniref:Acyl-[acyl-carrier-protein] dehydrogenase MbtN n=1 Tax=Parahaliea aestuarii TaxID=1852021 RepID=A0A5C8ZZQ0_9GAMM|nr:acyl-CoA dehydrogenase family protein [Parahaliea aestuarii]TXS93102.1 acyl-CoA dehydrogenase [Parahaliea aestuarii]
MYNDDIDAELKLFRESLDKFCEAEIEPFYGQWEKQGQVPRELFDKCAEAGLLCVDVPEAYGGLGVDPRFSFAVVEVMSRRGYGGFVGGLQVHNDIVPPYLLHFGSEEQKQMWLPKLCSGEVVSAIGMTEPGAGSDLKNLRTDARREGDGYVLSGSKIFISNGQHADLVLVAARTDRQAGAKGISLFLVDTRLPGFKRGRNLEKVGQHAADTSEMFFDEMHLPASALLGETGKGFAMMMQELPRERLIIAVQSVGLAAGARDLTLRYVGEREAFGSPIASLQNTRFTLAQVDTEIAAADALTARGIDRYCRGELTPEDAAAMKLFSSEVAGRVTDSCLQLFGGYGYMVEYPISRFWADARVIRIYGGTSEIMKEVIARSLLGR